MTLSDSTEYLDFNDYVLLKQRYLEILSKFSFLTDAIPDMGFIIDRKGVFIEFYPGQESVPIFKREEILKKNLLEILPSDPSIAILHWIKDAILTGKQFVYQFQLDKLGYLRDYEARGMRYSDNLVLLLVRDVTENLKVQRELIASEEKYRILVENSQDLIWKLDDEGRITYLNKSWEKSHGYNIEEMLGKRFTDFQNREMMSRDIREYNRLISEDSIKNYYTTHLAKNGTTIHLIFNAVHIYNEDGNITGLQGTAYDISYRKKMENELVKSSKLESLGILAGGITHDFNNILTGISGNVSLIKDIAVDHPEIEILSTEVLAAVKKATNLTKQMLTFAKGGEPTKDIIDVSRLIRTTSQFILRGSNIVPNFHIQTGLWSIEADAGQIDQVIQNLLINAIQSMTNGGKIDIRLKNGIPTDWKQYSYRDKKFITIEIRDYGSGISESDLDKVFDPFFTTKASGTGLGLTTAFSIIQRHDGDIRIIPAEGGGTKITVLLPAILTKPKQETSQFGNEKRIQENEYNKRILIMDDDVAVLNVFGRILSRLGCDYTLVRDGLAAIQEYRASMKSSRSYDGVILDLTIPGGMGGRETIRELKKLDPNIKAIVSSGYSDDPSVANFEKVGFAQKLEKPFTISDLRDIITKL